MTQKPSDPPQVCTAPHRRSNSHLARVVDIGLGYMAGLGYPHAKAYLREHGVPAEIIARVLSTGGPRRDQDNDDVADSPPRFAQ